MRTHFLVLLALAALSWVTIRFGLAMTSVAGHIFASMLGVGTSTRETAIAALHSRLVTSLAVRNPGTGRAARRIHSGVHPWRRPGRGPR